VTTDFGAELATPATSREAPPDADVATGPMPAGADTVVGSDPPPAKPAIEVTTDFGVGPARGPLAGFEVTFYGRFSGDRRGLGKAIAFK
jgi:hypothetical protein